ncbi:hypothetical protein WJX72_011763 [[Myrmecia] bisecta]|uniref:Charged multivesicular body protein 3 n=1 Tax=[Myrmecia] bisecta TaxID=41462 RepID=A0AAW1P3T9_9CHLO
MCLQSAWLKTLDPWDGRLYRVCREATSSLCYTALNKAQPDPKELVRKWQADLRTEQRKIERQIREIQRDEKVAQKQVKECAKRNDMQSAKVIARELVHTRRVVGRLYTNKAHIISMSTQLTEQLAMAKVAGSLKQSGEVMKLVNDLMKVPELMGTMQQMSKEMMKAGVIDEMMEDAMDSALDSEEVEEDAEAEVDKVLMEIAGETMGQLAAAPQARKQAAPQPQVAEAQPDDAEMEELQARLNAVRS